MLIIPEKVPSNYGQRIRNLLTSIGRILTPAICQKCFFATGSVLSPELVEASLESPETALENVVQRDDFLKYTTMVLLSCEAAILGGELLGNDSFVDHGWKN